MTKSELIDVITTVNRATTRDFLAEFAMRDLSDYMRRLESLGLLPPEYEARVNRGGPGNGEPAGRTGG